MATIKRRAYEAKRNSDHGVKTLANSVSNFLNSNRKTINISVLVLTSIVVLTAGFALKRSMDEKNAAPLLASAYNSYNPAGGSNPDYAKALELFRAIQKQYPSAVSGALAQYYAGNSLMSLGRHEEAVREYRQFVKEYSKDKLLLGLVHQRLGYAYRAMGKDNDAIKAFEEADSLIGPGISTVELARLYEAAGNSAESRNKYKMIAEKLAGTSLAFEAMGKVQKMEAAQPPVKEGK